MYIAKIAFIAEQKNKEACRQRENGSKKIIQCASFLLFAQIRAHSMTTRAAVKFTTGTVGLYLGFKGKHIAV